VIHSWWHQMRPNQKDLDDLRWQEAPWKQRLKGQTMRTNHFCYWTSTLLLWDTSACVCVCVCVAARKHLEVMYTEYINIFAYAHTHTHIYIYNYTWYMDHLCIYLLIFRPSVCTFIMEKVPLRWARHRGSMHQCFHGSRTASVARCFLMGIESVISWGNHGSIGKP